MKKGSNASMAQLTWATIPGAVDLPDANLAADQPVTDYSLTKISNNAKFAAVRPETFYGWYRHGETVVLPTSPVDGYHYSRAELEYDVAAWSTRAPASDAVTNGTLTKPARAPSQAGAGNLLACDFWVEEKNEPNPGLVHCYVSYYVQGGAETPTTDGFVKVRTIATRLSG
jgi:hypothetical protein